MIQDIVMDPEVLSKKCKPCAFFQLDVYQNKEIMQDLLETAMSQPPCVGLAANQVGFDKRIILIRPFGGKLYKIMVNPVIYCKTGGIKKGKEGCLSFPGKSFIVRRHKTVKVRYQIVTGRIMEDTYTGMSARVVQHEIGHLNGVLI